MIQVTVGFINEDSYEGDVTNPLSLNLYTYVHNNPLIYSDPTGHWCDSNATDKNGKSLWSHSGNCNTSTSHWSPDYNHIDQVETRNGKPYGAAFKKSDLSNEDKYVLWVRGDNDLYLSLDRSTQLILRKWALQSYMKQQIDEGFPDFFAGMNLDSSVLGTVNYSETNWPFPIKPQDAVSEWEKFLGPGNKTNLNPRTNLPDADRIFSEDGNRSIRFGNHEMGSSPNKFHYHEETWSHDPVKNQWNIKNVLKRVPLKK